MKEIRTAFSDAAIDRCPATRGDPDALADAWAHPATGFLPVWQSRCLIRDEQAVYLSVDDIDAHGDAALEPIFLGRRKERFLFAVGLETAEKPLSARGAAGTPGEFVGLRELASRLPESEAALLAYAQAMVSWQAAHRYCGRCGQANRPIEGGFVMACPDQDCGHRSFPRLDPAIIVLVSRNDRCLLGRQRRWPEGRFSTIAGFVEPAESLEEAIRREVLEETNVRVGACRYLASQPWPFPSALMLGFHAEGLSDEIRLNDGELAEARWITRDEIAARAVILPPPTSVAYRLIEAWFDAGDDGRRLADLVPEA